MAKKNAKGSFIVTVECTVKKEITVENCTIEQARSNPWDYAVEELETEGIDSRVISVRENN